MHTDIRRSSRLFPMVVAGGLALAVSTLASSAERDAPLSPPTDFALDDIEGQWHILAHIPYALERNRVAPTIGFTRRADGKFDEVFTARTGSFTAEPKSVRQTTWAPDPARPWDLKTRLFWVIPARYSVLHLDREAGVALLGTKDRDKAWIFARDSDMDACSYQGLLAQFARQGFDTARILRIPQRPDDLGKPGYAPIKP